MSDVALTGILLSRTAAQPAPAGVPAAVVNLPPELARAAPGSILHATVSGHDGSGHPILKTPQGALTLSTNLSLAAGSQVTLQLRSVGSQLHVSILQIDGRPVSVQSPQVQSPAVPADQAQAKLPAAGQTAAASAGPAGPAQTPGAASAPATAPSEAQDILALGQRLRAVVQSAAGQTAAVTAGPTSGARPADAGAPPLLSPGTAVEVRILRVAAPGMTGGLTGALTVGPSVLASPAGASPGPIAGQLAAGTPPAPPGQLLSATPLSAAPAAAPLAPAPLANTLLPDFQGPHVPAAAAAGANAVPPAGGIAMTAMVARAATPGQTLIATPLGVLALQVQAPLPPGARLEVEIFTRPAALPEPSLDGDGPGYLRQWSALEEALRSLMEAAPIDRQGAAVPPGVAQPGPRLASGMLFFLSAIAAGELSAWFGKKPLETLTSLGRGDLVTGLSRDFAQAARLFDAAGSDWRLLAMPLVDGDKVLPLRFFFRRGRGQGGEAGDRHSATRFIVDLELKRIGDLQLDGLVRPRRFDLILRTRAALPHHMRRDIAAIYESANAAGGTSGQIAFQANRAWQPMPLDTGSPAAGALVI